MSDHARLNEAETRARLRACKWPEARIDALIAERRAAVESRTSSDGLEIGVPRGTVRLVPGHFAKLSKARKSGLDVNPRSATPMRDAIRKWLDASPSTAAEVLPIGNTPPRKRSLAELKAWLNRHEKPSGAD